MVTLLTNHTCPKSLIPCCHFIFLILKLSPCNHNCLSIERIAEVDELTQIEEPERDHAVIQEMHVLCYRTLDVHWVPGWAWAGR